MSEQPTRIQRRRTKGWRMPEGAVSVTRPGRFGNPFKVGEILCWPIEGGADYLSLEVTPELAVLIFEVWARTSEDRQAVWIREHLEELRGRDLACYCAEGEPCHADPILRMANE